MTANNIFINAIKHKLQGQGIEKIVMIFDIITDKYNVMLRNAENKKMKIEISDNEITMLKKMFINKIVKKFNGEYPEVEVQKVIIQLDLINSIFEVFIEDQKNIVTKFNY
jgi:hypothetical protein